MRFTAKMSSCLNTTALATERPYLFFLSEIMDSLELTGVSLTGAVKLYNATSRLLEAEGRAMAAGEDIRHTIISNLDDPDNPRNQRIAVKGVIFDDLTLADWEAAKLGTIEAPFSAESYEILDY